MAVLTRGDGSWRKIENCLAERNGNLVVAKGGLFLAIEDADFTGFAFGSHSVLKDTMEFNEWSGQVVTSYSRDGRYTGFIATREWELT